MNHAQQYELLKSVISKMDRLMAQLLTGSEPIYSAPASPGAPPQIRFADGSQTYE